MGFVWSRNTKPYLHTAYEKEPSGFLGKIWVLFGLLLTQNHTAYKKGTIWLSKHMASC